MNGEGDNGDCGHRIGRNVDDVVGRGGGGGGGVGVGVRWCGVMLGGSVV